MIIKDGKRDNTKNKPIRAGQLKKILADVPANAIIVFQDVEEKKKTDEQAIVKDYILQKQTFSNGEEIKKLILTNNSRKLR